MTLSPDLTLVERALDALERREVRVLVWGLVDSALSEAEVDQVLGEVLLDNPKVSGDPGCTIATEADFRERLLHLGQLMRVPGRAQAPLRFRTRMAEGVRLFARLRQLFPGRHDGRDGWIGGSTLVADYRLLWRPRRYPKRDLSPTEAVAQIGRRVSNSQLMEAAQCWLDKADASWQLAQFQVDASARVLEGLDAQSPRGTLVAAGTGSGKTLAFYLPALSWLASQKKTQPQSRGARILALYPRNELLKDQLAEVFEQSRKFDEYLGRVGSTLSVGVLYGDTPNTLRNVVAKWQPTHGACPFFRCPVCDGELRLQSDQVAESEARLICKCGGVVDSGQLRFTRKAMEDYPPDILFTTVEMMNQRMSDSRLRHLFGLGPKAERVPPLMLLDEVHLYTGTFGAQVAHLLRRWSNQTRRKTQFVGLSATIAEGRMFFASLVNLDPSIVEEITPQHEDMVQEGAEYMLALRGDPVSQSALLSTSIQTLMLASRLLDRRQDVGLDKRPFSGWRAFAFTDQVDATNRLFYDLRDAEGRTERGHPATGRYPLGGLAHMREPGLSLRRYEGGQDWRLVKQIGHDLSTRHNVARTTAYDTGVSHDAEIVVATAALEVGYDDPSVGVVVQHKAPRDMAQFLQRKGRAGRTRHMRPWTVMVLSDYGRDRLAYQAYDQFFDPELPPRELPLSNRYIRRMQATYALIDYLGIAMQQGEPGGSVWTDLSGPQEGAFDGWPPNSVQRFKVLLQAKAFPLSEKEYRALKSTARSGAPERPPANPWAGANWLGTQLRRQHLVKLLGGLLKDDGQRESFAQYLSSALSLAREDVDTLLWDHPRPLLLAAIPTALRRLVTDWRAHGEPQADRAGRHPLPEFVPATLFSDLTLPEVRLLGGRMEGIELPVLQALSEMAPGKVSRRLDDALWLGPDEARLTAMLDAPEPICDVDTELWYDVEPPSSFQRIEGGQVTHCDAYRPLDLRLAPPPKVTAGGKPEVMSTSNARLLWRSQIFGRRAGTLFSPPPPERVGIAHLVSNVIVHTHASQSPATVRRYAVASKVGLRVRRSGSTSNHNATWNFTRHGRPCGIGFEIEVDALCFSLRLPASPSDELRQAAPAVQRAARSSRFLWEAQHGAALAAGADNIFLRGWLAQVFQVAAVGLAEEKQCDLPDAFGLLAEAAEAERLQDVLRTIFQSPEAPDDDEEQPSHAGEPRLRKALSDALVNPDTLRALRELGTQILTGTIDNAWDSWLRQTLMQTLAAALVDAIQQACPQVDPDELAVDIDPGPLEEGVLREGPQLWISEVNPGGNGLIEEVVEVLATDSDHFFRRVEAALGPSEFEQIDSQLRNYVECIGGPTPDDEWIARTQAVRDASSSKDAEESLAHLRRMLAERGHAVFHGYISALSNRLLRPETPQALDGLLADLLHRWDAMETRHGVEVEARVVCAVFSKDTRIDKAFTEAGFDLPANNRETWRFGMLLGVLWARGHALRANALPVSMRFADSPAQTERLLLEAWLSQEDDPIAGSDPNVLMILHSRLLQRGRAVIALAPDGALLNRIMSGVITTPVQLEYLNVYPRLTSAVRRQGEIQLHLELEATL